MRRYAAAAIIGLLLGGTAIDAPLSLAQDQPQGNRKLTNQVRPVYPELARKMQLRGAVRIEALVAPNGTVKSTKVIGGSPLLVQAAVDAIQKWRWASAPEETRELIELNFHP